MIIKGSATTAQLRFEIDGNTAGITRVITPPDQNVTLVSTLDGTILNSNVNASAAIDYSKLATLVSANILVGSGGAVATSVAMTGDIAINNTGVTSIVSGVILNADVNASAAIDYSKLATLTSANILVGNVSDVATSVAITGDTNIDNAGIVTAQPAIITGQTLKTTPIAADQILISDSEDSDNLKRVTISSAVDAVPQGILIASYDTEIVSDALFWTVSGFNTDDATFLNRASPVPIALTFSRLTVNVSVNSNAGGNDVTFDLAIGPTPTLGNSTVTITGGVTGSFTDVTNSDALTSGINIAYQLNDGTGVATNVTLVGSSGMLRGT